jgi:hypothetical protein
MILLFALLTVAQSCSCIFDRDSDLELARACPSFRHNDDVFVELRPGKPALKATRTFALNVKTMALRVLSACPPSPGSDSINVSGIGVDWEQVNVTTTTSQSTLTLTECEVLTTKRTDSVAADVLRCLFGSSRLLVLAPRIADIGSANASVVSSFRFPGEGCCGLLDLHISFADRWAVTFNATMISVTSLSSWPPTVNITQLPSRSSTTTTTLTASISSGSSVSISHALILMLVTMICHQHQ